MSTPGFARRRFRRASRKLRRHRPPPVPAGAETGPPDFVGVGVPRAGTTWWWSLLVQHPEIADLDKERYFLTRFVERAPSTEDAAEYARLFPRVRGERAGEWSPGYLHNFWVPAALRAVAPDARVLVLLRDPVERYRSGINKTARADRPALEAGRAFAQGCYASQLERLFAVFPRDRVLVLQFERCVAEPGAELARTLEFLGVDAAFTPPDLAAVVNASPDRSPLEPGLATVLADAYAAEIERLDPLVPDLDLGRWASARRGSPSA